MIAPQELRIGNFVEVENYKIIQLENIHPKGTTKGDEQYLISMLKPIELTEEWLLNFGFEKDDTVDEIDGVLFALFHLGDYIVEYWIKDNRFKFTDDCALEVFVSSVHQLQNLFFAITTEELIIKEQENP